MLHVLSVHNETKFKISLSDLVSTWTAVKISWDVFVLRVNLVPL